MADIIDFDAGAIMTRRVHSIKESAEKLLELSIEVASGEAPHQGRTNSARTTSSHGSAASHCSLPAGRKSETAQNAGI